MDHYPRPTTTAPDNTGFLLAAVILVLMLAAGGLYFFSPQGLDIQTVNGPQQTSIPGYQTAEPQLNP